MIKKNKLIVLEGLDRSGKTSIAKLLAESLGQSTVVRFPDRTTKIGQLLDRFLKKEDGYAFNAPELHLLYSANRYENIGRIQKALEHGSVICDRYWLSGSVFSTAKGLDYEWCKSVDSLLPQPDFCFFIDIDEVATSKRLNFGEEAHDIPDLQRRAYRIYKDVCSKEGMIPIDGNKPLDYILSEILEIIGSSNTS